MTRETTATSRPMKLFLLASFALGTAAVGWAHATTLQELARRWATDAQYSHGYLVPGFALILLWLRRDKLNGAEPSWLGLPLLAAGLGLRLYGTYFYYVWLEAISLLPCLAGLYVTVGGRPAWRWSWPAVAFLFFMVPLPYRFSTALSGPLQALATVASTFALQTLGLPAVSEGNVILLNETEIGVVEACSGLRMLVIFFALTTAVALLSARPLWERFVMIASAVPIALLSNLIRITATGVLHETAGSEIANAVFHDLAGWLMMPLALGMLWMEFKFYSLLVVEPSPRMAAPPPGPRPRQVPPPRRPGRTRTRTERPVPGAAQPVVRP